MYILTQSTLTLKYVPFVKKSIFGAISVKKKNEKTRKIITQ